MPGIGPFSRSTAPLRIQAKTTRVDPAAWPKVNCTSMESGCKCVGPVPAFSQPEEGGEEKDGPRAAIAGCAGKSNATVGGDSSSSSSNAASTSNCVQGADDDTVVMTLLPFGSTDLRIAVMPVHYV